MKKFLSSKKIALYLLAALSVLVFLKFMSLISFSDSEIVLEKGEIVEIKKNETLAQKFISKRDGLVKISFLIRSSGIKKGDKVNMKLLDENCEKTLREGLLKDSFVDSGNLYEFKFKKVPNSKDKAFCIQATFKSKKENPKPIRFYVPEKNIFPFVAENITTGEKAGGHISMRPAYKNKNFVQDMRELSERISQYKPWFLKHYFLWALAIFFIILSFGIVIILIK